MAVLAFTGVLLATENLYSDELLLLILPGLVGSGAAWFVNKLLN
jgi:hypothetical protein